MTDKRTANLTVNFVRPAGDGGSGDDPGNGGTFTIALSLDAAKNAEVYGQESKTTFAPGETAYILAAPSGVYVLTASAGTIKAEGTGIPKSVTESVTFANSRAATLPSTPMGAVSWEWQGRSGGTPLFTGANVTVPVAVTGVLKCTYAVAVSRFSLTLTTTDMNGAAELSVLVVAEMAGQSGELSVDFGESEGDGGGGDEADVPVEILVTDYCTGDPIPGARVYVAGKTLTTNAAGLVYVGLLTAGQTIPIRCTATHFEDTDQDILNNDSFVVPIS